MASERRFALLGPLPSGVPTRAFLGVELVDEVPSPERPIVAVWIPDEVLEDDRQLARLQRETSVVVRLQHPNLIGVHGLVRSDAGWARLVDFVDGEPLSRVLTQAAASGHVLPPAFAARIVTEVCEGVSHAHQEGLNRFNGRAIVHGGLRPDTLLLGFDGLIRVTGYGAAVLAPNQSDGWHPQTSGYLAPEQVLGGRATGSLTTDVYAIGAVLYALLSGRAPFHDADDLENAILAQKAPVVGEGEFARRLGQVAARAMAKRGPERFASVDALRTEILQAVAESEQDLPSAAAMSAFVEALIPPDSAERQERAELLVKVHHIESITVLTGPTVVPRLSSAFSEPGSEPGPSGPATEAPPADTEPVASEPGAVASEPGAVASEPGAVASEPGAVASEETFIGPMPLPAPADRADTLVDPPQDVEVEPTANDEQPGSSEPASDESSSTDGEPDASTVATESAAEAPTSSTADTPATGPDEPTEPDDTQREASLYVDDLLEPGSAAPRAHVDDTEAGRAAEADVSEVDNDGAVTEQDPATSPVSGSSATIGEPYPVRVQVPPMPPRVVPKSNPGNPVEPIDDALLSNRPVQGLSPAAGKPAAEEGARVITQFNRRSGDASLLTFALVVLLAAAVIAFIVLFPKAPPAELVEGADKGIGNTDPVILIPPAAGSTVAQPAARSPSSQGAASGPAVDEPQPGAPPPPPSDMRGRVKIRTDPRVTVLVGDQDHGSTPVTLELPEGRHRVRLVNRRAGIQTFRTAQVRSGQTIRWDIAFGKCRLRVEAPAGAEIKLNGKALGTAPIDEMMVYEGSYLLRVDYHGAVWTERFRAPAGGRLRFTVRLKDAPR